jgi:hypothetical protein
VDIDVSTTMSQADVQTVVNEILTVTGDFDYTAGASTIAETTFNNLSGVQSLTLKQGGGYHVKGLVSASNIVLDDTWKSTVTIVDLRSLTTVTSLSNEGQANGYLKFDKATEMHLTSLALFGTGGLDLQVKKGGVIDLTALDDLNSVGTAVGATYALSIDGPASAGNANIGDGVLTFTNVATVSVSGFIGDTTIGAGVENLTVNGAVGIDISNAADLVTANITGALDTDAARTTADTAGPAIAFKSTDLTTATVAGVVASIDATEQSNLETLTITADTKGGALTVDDNDDLVTLTVTGAKLGNVTVMDNGDLESATMDHTTTLATGDTGATLSVTGNTNMTSFTWGADDVDSITVTGNTQLAAINFTGLADWGTSTKATVTISGNSLTATSFKDAYDATPATSDTGAFDAGTSGMKTLKPYLTAVLTSSTSVIGVYFDVIETLTEQLTSAATAYTDVAGHVDTVSGNTRNAYAYQTAAVPDAKPAVKQVNGYIQAVKLNALYANADLNTGEGMKITLGGIAKQWIKGTPATVTSVATLISAINAETAWGTGYTVTAAQDAMARSYNKFNYTDEAGAAETLDTAGTILVSLGGVTSVVPDITRTGSNTTLLAAQIAATISGTVVNGVGYWAAGSGQAIVLSRLITNTQIVDEGQYTGSFPVIAIDTGNATFTTVDFSDNAGTTNSTGVNSDFFIGFQQSNTNGLRVSVQNNSTTVALVAADVVTNVQVKASDASNALGIATEVVGAPAALVSGTNMTGNASIDSAWSEVYTPGSGVLAVVKNRTGW